jgi:ABC-type transporter Mla subunit MlaD
MEDRSLGVWLMVIFGVSGVAAVVLAWLLPSLQSDRIPATIVGLAGIGVAIFRGLMLRKDQVEPAEKLTVEVHAENED